MFFGTGLAFLLPSLGLFGFHRAPPLKLLQSAAAEGKLLEEEPRMTV